MTVSPPAPLTRLLSPLYIWPGGWLVLLSAMDNRPHQHVAASLLVSLDGLLRVNVDDRCLQQPLVRVPPEARQSLHSDGPVAVMHLDPDEPAWWSLREADADAQLPLPQLRQGLQVLADGQPHADLAGAFIQQLRASAPLNPPDARVVRACQQLRADNSLDLDALAAGANLSASRFRRLFSEQLGVTFKRYVLHLKCQRALSLWESGMTLTELAVAAGFYDQPHLNRTLRAMFDALPSRYARGQSVQVVDLSANTRTTSME
ncbi:AraC family transcriptional regulator [Alcanivorax sp. DP30]|uniref:helix-turn-helix domain-containing protein n=1 Tax=Alcanivorax sp. DP30 TaxID=2606217 RepID=UPI00136D1295|nr:AraC family transcriptional regulator [Alcanivorax sp. DP30]MZR62836.1 helix-turn-helix domain-containing protein [Alcanivorax sp. DP30]